MSDLRKLEEAKRRADKTQYRKGLEDGALDVTYIVCIVAVVVAIIA